MNMFNNISTEGVEEAKDVVGGGFDPLPTDIYDATVKLMYAGEAESGAKNVTVILDVNGQEVKETIYVTTRNGDPFYIDKNDGKTKHPLPGWTTIEDLCLLTTEKDLTQVDIEEKTVKVFDPAERKEVNKPVPVIVEALGQKVRVALQRQIVDKEKKGDDGKYHPTGETRTQNEIIKFVHPETSRTVNEYRHNIEESVWADEWLNKFRGKDRNRASNASNGAGKSGSGRPGAGGAGNSGSGKPASQSLFGKK